VILGIDVHVVFGIQDNVGADIVINTVAESADLVNKLISRPGNRNEYKGRMNENAGIAGI
jgi:hypothetical protein